MPQHLLAKNIFYFIFLTVHGFHVKSAAAVAIILGALPGKTVPEITYTVFDETLNSLTQRTNLGRSKKNGNPDAKANESRCTSTSMRMIKMTTLL